MFILSFFACSPSIDSFDANNDALASTKEEGPAPVTPPEQLQVEYNRDAVGFIEVRPYAPTLEGGFVSGPPLFVEELDGEAMFLDLPEVATTPDGSQPISPVVYAIALRETNEDGLPGIYLGVASSELVWLPEDLGDGKAGWNMALHFGSKDVQWLDMDKGAYVIGNLVGLDLLRVEGTLDIPMQEGMRLVFATGTEEEHVTIWDNPIGEEWSGTLPDVPPVETITERNGMFGATFGGWAYVDADEDGVRTDEPYVGHLFADGAPVVMSWVAPARTLPNALSIRRNHTSMGWVPYAQVEDRLVLLNEEMEITVGPF